MCDGIMRSLFTSVTLPTQQHSSEDHSAPVVQSTRRTLTFTSKVSEDVDPSSQVSATGDAVNQVSG